eukprot:scaffold1900_cov389-Prasinococcus_capsulatus_cf.AAC.24
MGWAGRHVFLAAVLTDLLVSERVAVHLRHKLGAGGYLRAVVRLTAAQLCGVRPAHGLVAPRGRPVRTPPLILGGLSFRFVTLGVIFEGPGVLGAVCGSDWRVGGAVVLGVPRAARRPRLALGHRRVVLT